MGDNRIGDWRRTGNGNFTRRFQDEDGEWRSVTVFRSQYAADEEYRYICEGETSEVGFDDEIDALHQAEEDLIPRSQWSDW